jgi:hypothetical protein
VENLHWAGRVFHRMPGGRNERGKSPAPVRIFHEMQSPHLRAGYPTYAGDSCGACENGAGPGFREIDQEGLIKKASGCLLGTKAEVSALQLIKIPGRTPMPQIIVTADKQTERGESPVMFRERVSVRDFESEHFAAQLMERLGWAVGDAQAVEREPDHASEPEPWRESESESESEREANSLPMSELSPAVPQSL